MAITEISKLEQAVRRSGSNAGSLTCGSVYAPAGTSVPAGNYVAVQSMGNTVVNLTNIVYQGAPMYASNGNILSNLALPREASALPVYMNIESCDTDVAAIFYFRCNS